MDVIRLNGKSYSLPLEMVFKKYHCAKCGAKLEKERTHRVVTKDDQDYYRYHSRGKFPRRDYDVYNYRFQCPGCGARISFDEQCIIESIQKKQGHTVLSSSEIKSNYAEGKERHHKWVLLKNILNPFFFALVAFVLFDISNLDRSTNDLMHIAIIFSVTSVIMAVGAIIRYKGAFSYSYEKEAQLKKLHTYSAHNRDRIAVASKCYCFHCKAIVESRDIQDYTDNGQTAICPKCGIASIIPDSIEEGVDEQTIAEMNEYWF
jgi:Zn finger protein HypA/HybF involved in hydrogenase expression